MEFAGEIAAGQIVVSLAVAYFAWAQLKTNRTKLRLDLYNRRFAVFEKTLSYFQTYYSPTATEVEVRKSADDFVRAYRESRFLFGDDSAVYAALTKIKDVLGELVALDRRGAAESLDQDAARVVANRRMSLPDPSNLMKSLEEAMAPWLDFRRIARKH